MLETAIVHTMTVQASYCYNIVRTDSRNGTRPVTWHREPRTFAGSADQFAQTMLDDVMSRDPQLAGEFVFVNAWDSDGAGVFDPAHIAGRARHDPKASIRRSAPVAGGTLPATPAALVLRTDFSDDAAWDAVCTASAAETPEGFMASLSFVSDPAFADMPIDQVAAQTTASRRTFLFIVDRITVTDREMPIVAVDMHEQPGRWFRLVPAEMASVENNLSLANMDFRDFADGVEPDGVFRGWPRRQR